MKVEFDPAKRDKTLKDRGLDFADAAQMFGRRRLTLADDRVVYPEPRFQTFGTIDDRLVIVVWTPVVEGIRVISMRKCNDRACRKYASRLG